MSYLIDTNVVIDTMRRRLSPVRGRLADAILAKSRVAISTISVFELWYGVERSSSPEQNALKLKAFLRAEIEILPFSDDDARAAAIIRARLGASGTPIGPYDILIAAQALNNDLTLVTGNVSEFSRVTGLRRENWRE